MTRAKFLAVLDKHGATLDTDCEECNLNIDSPKGKVFRATNCHVICVAFRNPCQSWKSEAYAEAAAEVDMGMYDCDPDCDVCAEK